MRTFTIFGLIVTAGLVTASLGASPARADEHRGTFEQQMACTPDVFRLCGSAIPDEDRIVNCLRQNTMQLSRNCRAVFVDDSTTAAATSGSATTVGASMAPARRQAPNQNQNPQPQMNGQGMTR